MGKPLRILTVLVIVGHLMTACGGASTNQVDARPTQPLSERDAAFAKFVSYENLNAWLTLAAAPDFGGNGTTSFGVHISNISEHEIDLPKDLGVRLFVYKLSTKQWTEIDDLTVVLGDDPVVLDPMGGLLSDRYWVIQPELPSDSDFQVLRVLVVGVASDSDGTALDIAATLDYALGDSAEAYAVDTVAARIMRRDFASTYGGVGDCNRGPGRGGQTDWSERTNEHPNIGRSLCLRPAHSWLR